VRRANPEELVASARGGDRLAVARLLSLAERGGAPAVEVGRLVYPLGGRAYTVGITGAPGAGKSTLTDRLLQRVRARGEEVAVLAIDPSSPKSGGAFLGDRVRMQDHATDGGVFVRSMASRGHLGGLSLATPEAIRVLDAAGFPLVFVETVGVGQVEIEIAGAADTTVVVMNPGWGDSIQANKAGLIEVADVFVINRADRPGVEEARRDLQWAIDQTAADGDAGLAEWKPPIVLASATQGQGIDEVLAAIADHRSHVEGNGELERRRAERLGDELEEIVVRRLERRAHELVGDQRFDRLRTDMLERRTDPYSAAEEVLAALEK
jgi:LAO/AO transport system kinase